MYIFLNDLYKEGKNLRIVRCHFLQRERNNGFKNDLIFQINYAILITFHKSYDRYISCYFDVINGSEIIYRKLKLISANS